MDTLDISKIFIFLFTQSGSSAAESMDTFSRLSITDLDAYGQGIATVRNKPVFVKGALPGEIVSAQMTEKTPGYYRAVTRNIIEASDDRQSAFCGHFPECGGCQLQHMKPKSRRLMIQKNLSDALAKIKVDDSFEPEGFTPGIMTLYRNKIQTPVRDAFGSAICGYYELFSHDQVPL